MPRTQAAHVATYQFGAPGTKTAVLAFEVRQGGRQEFRFESADADEDVTVSVEVSEDGSSFVATTAADNVEAVTDEVIKPRTSRNFSVLLRAGKDLFVRVLASGDDRGEVQIRGPAELEISTFGLPANQSTV